MNQFIQIEEAAQILCCSTRTIRRKLNKVNKKEFSKIIDGRLFIKRIFIDNLQSDEPASKDEQLYFVLYSKTQDCHHIIRFEDFNYIDDLRKGWQQASLKYMTFDQARTFIQLRNKWMRESYKITIDFERVVDGEKTRLMPRCLMIDNQEQDASFLFWLGNAIMIAAQQQQWQEQPPTASAIATPKEPRKGFVYLMHDKNTGQYKIGFSKDPKYRERTLQSEKPTIELLHKFKSTIATERKLHNLYADKRTRGEWFKLTKEDVNHIKALK